MSRPRVAMVSLSTLSTGGIETHLMQIFHGLGKEFDFYVIGTLGEPFLSLAVGLGVKCISLPPTAKANPLAFLRLLREFRTCGIGLVHTHDTRGGLLGRIAASAAGIPAVHTVHTPAFFLPRSPLAVAAYRLVEQQLNRRATDKVIFVSKTIRQIYLDGRLVGGDTAGLVPNGLEGEWFAPVQHIIRDGGDIRFLYVGRMAREKGIGNLAEAFGITAEKIPAARLVAAGEGPGKAELIRAADRGGWRNRLDLPGLQLRGRIRETMRTSDVFVLPSEFESFSYTLLEAMASGLPCIATDVGGNRDLVEPDRTGLLVPRGDPRQLAGAMIRLAGNPPMRIDWGREGAVRAREYTLERMIDGTRTVYQEVLARNPSTGRS
jgi:glycosyltransferase involved in cell wall biosynthesis